MNYRGLAALAIGALFPGVLLAAPDARLQREGVTIDAYSQNDRITFCFDAEKNVKIASEYGVEFAVPREEAKLWEESFPKIVSGKEPYFKLPVRIELRTRGVPRSREVSVGLGICVSETYCTPIKVVLRIPAKGSSRQSIACSGAVDSD